jgi:hypothetical protein
LWLLQKKAIFLAILEKEAELGLRFLRLLSAAAVAWLWCSQSVVVLSSTTKKVSRSDKQTGTVVTSFVSFLSFPGTGQFGAAVLPSINITFQRQNQFQ